MAIHLSPICCPHCTALILAQEHVHIAFASSFREAVILRSRPYFLDTRLGDVTKCVTLPTAIEGVGATQRRGQLMSVYRLLHFPQHLTDLFHRTVAQGMDALPRPQSKALSGR